MAKEKPEAVTVQLQPVTEQIVLAAAAVDPEARARLVKRFRPDHFLVEAHRPLWAAMQELERRRLDYDPAILQRLAPGADAAYLGTLVAARPEAPGDANLAEHEQAMLWDHQRAQVAAGALGAFLEAFKDPKEQPDRVRALARQLADSMGRTAGSKWLRDPGQAVDERMREVERRVRGDACYPYGIPGLDFYERGASDPKGRDISGRHRMLPGAAPGQVTVVTAVSGGGKALALDTPIATVDGWTTMGEVVPGMSVFGMDGMPTEVVAATEVMTGRVCYEVSFSDGERIVADGEHVWRTLTFRDRYLLSRRMDESRERQLLIRRKKTGAVERREWVSASLREHYATRREAIDPRGSVKTTREIAGTLMNGKHRNHAVPVTMPLRLPKASLLVDPYVLGVWLGDGSSDGGTLTNYDEEIVNEVAAEHRVTEQRTPFRWTIRGLVPKLRRLGVLGGKRIPPEYLRASFEQRLALLQGLMDTDGGCTKDGKCNFDNTNEVLVWGFAELLSTLGIKAAPKPRDAVLNGRVVGTSWRFVFQTDLPVFRLRRKLSRRRRPVRGVHAKRYVVAVREVPSVPVRCIQVRSEDGMYLAGRGMVPTHNSTFLSHVVLGLVAQGRRVLYAPWEMGDGRARELLACIEMGWNRTDLTEGLLTGEDLGDLRRTMEEQAAKFTMFENPFQKSVGGKESNARNLDVVQQHIEDSGCDVFVVDPWDRCLVDTDPSEEKRALERQQAMAEECRVHAILTVQQRLKDIEMRQDKRPTREGIMGSSAWVQVADCILAPYLPAMWKAIPDDTMEVIVWKQRDGRWPQVVALDWDPECGSLGGGRSVPFEHLGEQGGEIGEFGRPAAAEAKAKQRAKRGRPR